MLYTEFLCKLINQLILKMSHQKEISPYNINVVKNFL